MQILRGPRLRFGEEKDVGVGSGVFRYSDGVIYSNHFAISPFVRS